MITPGQINLLIKMSDPKKLQALKDNGLPTIDLVKIKDIAQKKLETSIAEMTSTLSNAVGSMQQQADKMIQEKIDQIEALGKTAKKALSSAPSSIAGAGGQAANALQMEVEKLKQAKEHGLATGNFVPLMALLNPSTNLKSLLKDTVVLPKIELPKVPKL